jgi:hypothetical protein
VVQVKVGPHLNSIDNLNGYPLFPQDSKSLLAKNLTLNIWKNLKDTKDSSGYSFK